ncbi:MULTISPECIES: hypothetical protein [unclassified Sphingomonas]|uniref:hypothetical protein n=1 Tax=unclassified Sphingomonas TaxID=196159 RepID=UPI0021506FE1|nr:MULTISPECIES: hypothetical protein [unclassified Sphingomonas]MCR5871602.1 hypothetical protein [Sphingomonas sp. J344]UUY00105.1 hypothetical protein LRS08_02930 [Sphingomonas sp. J315]
MRLIIVGAMMAIAVPAAGGQFLKFDGVKGESRDDVRCIDIVAGAGAGAGSGAMKQAKLTPRKAGGGGNGEAIQGGLDRDIIRRIPKGPPPKPQEARGGVQVAVGDVTGDGRADGKAHKMDSITLKQGAAAGRPKYGDITLKRGAAAGC